MKRYETTVSQLTTNYQNEIDKIVAHLDRTAKRAPEVLSISAAANTV
jgi:hypothetical protein